MIYKVTPDSRAEVVSYYIPRTPWFADEEQMKIPAAYKYENEKGQRFFVMSMLCHYCLPEVVFKSYGKARQLADAAEWVSGKSLPAKCQGNPGIYMLCKEDGEDLAVGIWNISQDRVDSPKVTLPYIPKTVEYIGCTGKIEADGIVLSPLEAYSFCAVVVKKK